MKLFAMIYLLLFALVFSLNAQDGGLVAHFTFDETEGTTAADLTGNHSGELMGDAAWDENGKYDGAIFLDGTEDYVKTTVLDELKEATDFTIMCWFNTELTADRQQHILWVGNVAGNGWGPEQELHLTVNHFNYPDRLSFYYGLNANEQGQCINILTPDDFTDVGGWHHLAGIVTSAEGENGITRGALYLDGELVTPYDWAGEFPTTDSTDFFPERGEWDTPLYIGQPGFLNVNRSFIGLIDEVRVYDKALTSEDIVLAMNNEPLTVKESLLATPESFALHANYPNPFNPETRIRFDLKEAGQVKLSVFSLMGEKIAALSSGLHNAGSHEVVWNGRTTSGSFATSGMYIYRLEYAGKAGQKVLSKKMLLLK